MKNDLNKSKKELFVELAELRKKSQEQEDKLNLLIKELEAKVSLKSKDLKKSKHNYEMLFNESPVPTWEEDFSQCKTYIDSLKNKNIKDFREYFKKNADEVIEASKNVKIININKAAVKLHEAQSKQELLHSLSSIFTEKSYETFIEQLICIANGKKEYESEGIVKTIDGLEKNILLKWAVVPGYEDTLEKVYVTTTNISKLKQSQDLQRESEDRFNTIVNASPDGIGISDLNGIIEFVAPQTIKMWAYSKEEFIGKHIYEVIHKNSHAIVDHMIAELLKGNDLGALEYEMIRKDGTIFICEANCSLLYDKNNKPEKVLYIQRDITERKRTEEALVESEMKFRKLAESTVMGIGLYQNDYWIYANPAAEEITGYTLDELKQLKFWDLIGPEYIDIIKERGKARQKGEYVPSGYEIKIITKQGKEKWVFLTGNTIELKSGKAGLISVIDITERKLAEEALKKSEDKYRKIFENVQDIFYQADNKGNIIEISPSIKRYSGYSREELIGTPVARTYHNPNDRLLLMAELEAKGEIVDYEIRLKTKSERLIYVSLNAHLLYDENKKPTGIEGSLRDITERKQAEEEIRKLSWVVESATQAIMISDLETNLVYVNQALLDLGGFNNQKELIGKSIFAYTNEKGKMKIQDEIIPLLLEKASYRGEITLKKKDNNHYPAEINCSLIKDEKGTPIYFTAIFEDISERKLAEESLKNSEETFKGIFNNTTDAIYVQDEDGVFLDVNQCAINMYGYTREELIGNTPELVSAPGKNDLEKVKEYLQKANMGVPQQFEFWGMRKNGEVFPKIVRLSASNYFGKKIILAFATDITELKQAEEELKKNEKKHHELSTLLRLMTDNMPDMLWAKNLNNEYVFVNKAMCKGLLNAKDTDEPLGRTDMFFAQRERNAHPDNPEWHTFGELCRDTDAITLKALKPVQFDEFGNVRGKFLFLDVHKAPLYDSDGKLIGTVGSARDVTVAKKAEKQLSNLSRAVEQSPSSVVITDIEGTLKYVNPKFIEITGYTFEEAIGQKSNLLKSGEHSKVYYRELWKTISSGQDWRGEFHNKKKNGQLFWEMASISPIFDEQGKIINYVGVAEDITDRKRNEQIQNIIHNISNAVIISHSQEDFLTLVENELGKLIDTTNFFVALYNEETDSISLPFHHDEKDSIETFPAGKTMTKYVIKTGKSLLATKALRAKLEKSGEFESIGHPSEVWLGVPLKNKKKVIGIFAVQSYDNENAYDEADVKMLEIISDQISLSLERLKAEEDLKLAKEKAEESEYKIRSMFENTQIGILYCNAEGKILEANQVLLDILGSPSMDATSKINLLTFKPLQGVGFAQNVEKCISEKRIITEDTVYTSKWGKTIFMKYYLIPVILNNKVIGVWANLNNLTDLWNTQNQLKKAKEKAEESDYLKSAFLANMSHEIRTPMNGILGFTGLLKEPQLTGDEKDQYIEVIERSGKRMLNTINDIIDISKIEAGQVEVVYSEVSVSKILEEQYNFFQLEAQSKGLELIYQFSSPNKELRMITDQQKLEGILINLIKNAFKFTEEGSISFGYTIKKRGEKEFVEFFVKDTGIGIPANRIDAVFKRFEQADIQDTRAFEGSGLGLAISKSYVEMLGGEMGVSSKEGEGSTFTFSIPYNRQNLKNKAKYG